jgi:hypothetical protein
VHVPHDLVSFAWLPCGWERGPTLLGDAGAKFAVVLRDVQMCWVQADLVQSVRRNPTRVQNGLLQVPMLQWR